jgi:DNA helicase-2/ATP-dependent DNA helicase PcrA
MRLAYVAFTRAKHGLLLSTSHFRNGENAVVPSKLYLICAQHLPNIAGATVLTDTPIPDGKNPLIENPITGTWPDKGSRYELKAAQVREQAKLLLNTTAFTNAELDAQNLIKFEDKNLVSDLQAVINELNNRSDLSNVFLPTRLSVSTLLCLKLDPDELALRLRRPMPNHIDKFARRGTQFHLWLEEQFKADALHSSQEAFYGDLDTNSELYDAPIQELQRAWQQSQWADRKPIGVEVGFETVIAGVVIRGRIDAVYEVSPGKFEVVDWKTGKVKSGDDLSVAALQLAMYRLAFSKLNNLELANVSAAFHYVAQNETVRPTDLMDESELIQIISAIPQLQSDLN